ERDKNSLASPCRNIRLPSRDIFFSRLGRRAPSVAEQGHADFIESSQQEYLIDPIGGPNLPRQPETHGDFTACVTAEEGDAEQHRGSDGDAGCRPGPAPPETMPKRGCLR